ncbi:MAG TPA: DUF222 domain-containing protein, partial [Streptosporangiaceae bacterium]
MPASTGEALEMVLAGLGYLASADLASVPGEVHAECLRGLERASSMQAAAHARVLAAFCAQAGYEADGQGSPRTWLIWQTRVSRQTANAAIASMRRLKAHAEVANALADGAISQSWAGHITDWTDKLPEDARPDADEILLAAAAGGAELADLARLAEEMRRRLASPDRDDDGFDDRSVRLATTLDGAGKLHGDLTPQCAAALRAVLEALGKRAGPDDNRSIVQRRHDALEEACRRLLGSDCLPDRAGQPTQLQLHITLDELANGVGPDAVRPGPVLPGPAARPGDDCDAAIAPVVTGTVDRELLGALAARLSDTWDRRPALSAEPPPCPCGHTRCPGTGGDHTDEARSAYLGWAAARELILSNAVALLSGPDGLASWLRRRQHTGAAASISLPLDVGKVTEVIPPHLRRAVIARDKHCAAPGCDQAPAACQVHHIIPRSKGGITKLTNLMLLCTFHHLIMVHRWGWTITLNPDGTTTAASPD